MARKARKIDLALCNCVTSSETQGRSVGPREKARRKFQVWAEKPLGTDSHRTISKRSSECWLLIGHKNALYYCAQSANSISWVLFVSSYTTAIDSITACLAHAPKKCTQSGNFQFDIKSPSDFKILSARKLKTLFQKYKLELTTGIHACIDHAFVNIREFNMPRQLTTTKTSHEEWTHIFSVSIVIIPTHLLCQMQANSSGAEFLSTISKFIKRKKILT